MTSMMARVTTCAAAACAVLGIAACGGSSTSSGTGSGSSSTSASTTLTLGTDQSAITTFNPYSAEINSFPGQMVYDTLTHLNSKGQATPNVVTAWTVKGTSVTMQVRRGLTFDDGTSIDAAAIKDDLDYGIAHATGNDLSANCFAYLDGATVSTVGKYEVTMKLAAPTAGLMQEFAQCDGFVVEPKYLSDQKALTAGAAGTATGPYELDASATVSGQHYTWVARKNYWDAKAYGFKKVVETVYSSDTALEDAAESGQVDLTAQIFNPKNTMSGMTMIHATRPDQFRGFYITDVTGAVSKPLGNVKVRQAMEYALDRKLLGTSLYGAGNFAVTSSTPFPSFYSGYSSAVANYYSYDITKAKQLLAEAGYPHGFTVNALVDPPDEQFAEAVAGEERQIGVNIAISVHSTDFITQMETGKWPLVSGNFSMNPVEFATVSSIVGKEGFWNPRHNSDAVVTSLLSKAQNATTASAAKAAYAKLAMHSAQAAWFLNPVFVTTTYAARTSRIHVVIIPGVGEPTPYDMQPAK